MPVLFLADADLDHRIVTATRRRESKLDFLGAEEAGLRGLSDLEVLRLAAEHGRVLVTHDRRTMPHWFAQFVEKRDSPGLIVVSQRLPIAQAADELRLIWSATDAAEWVNQVVALPL